MIKTLALTLLTLLSIQSLSASQLKVHQLASNVYALVGELTQRSPTNFGNNSTHGVIVTDEGVILIDSGGTYLGALQIHDTIKTITNKPIAIVINSGGQDHRWFGNSYFKALGARLIATQAANKDQHARADSQMTRLDNLIGDSLNKTEPLPADELFETSRTLTFGGTTLELYHEGPAHTAGDLFVWMPSTQIMFTGDIVFNNRMLGIGPAQDSASWIHVFEKMAAFNPKHIIPGHGDPSDLTTATQNTYDYLVFLRQEVAKILDNDGDMQDTKNIDQSAFHYLKNHESIAGRNSQWVFEKMEFDF